VRWPTVTKIRVSDSAVDPKHITDVWLGSAPAWSAGDEKIAVLEAVRRIAAGAAMFVKNPATGNESKVIVVGSTQPHIRTTPDGTKDDNLLSLPRE